MLSFGDQQTPEVARFGFSGNPTDGAFVAGKAKIGFKYPKPAAKKWHQIAYTQDANGEVKLYLDGELQQTANAGAPPVQSPRLQIGASWPAKRGTPIVAQQFALSKLRVYDEALGQRQIRNDNNQFNTFAPEPADKAATTGFNVTLKWSEGDPTAKSVNVYFGTDKSAVAVGSPVDRVFKGNFPTGILTLGPIPIDLERTYYWRVDELSTNEAGPTTSKPPTVHVGDVWSFTSESGAATAPNPRTAVSAVPVNTASLTWTAGKYATSQAVYFGTSIDDVKSGKAFWARV